MVVDEEQSLEVEQLLNNYCMEAMSIGEMKKQ